MKPDRRWMQWILTESANLTVALPWQRALRQPKAPHLTEAREDPRAKA